MQAKHRIIVIDDEPDMVRFLCTWLKDLGYETYSAADGKQGMRLIERERPDVILLDLKMHTQTGLELYREICRSESLRHIPVILITAMTDFQLIDSDCSPLQAPVACLDKPIDLKALHSAIRQAIS